MLVGVSQPGFTLGCFQHGRRKKNELQPNLTTKFHADQRNQEISLSLEERSLLYRLEGVNTFFQRMKRKSKANQEAIKGNVPGRGRIPWYFIMSIPQWVTKLALSHLPR